MCDAPERLLLELRQGMTFDAWSECRDPRYARSEPVEYIRADLSDALLREAVDALDDARQSLVDSSEEIAELRLTLSKTDLELPWLSDAIDKQTIALAKLRAHLEGEKE